MLSLREKQLRLTKVRDFKIGAMKLTLERPTRFSKLAVFKRDADKFMLLR